jgi:hypothetical protein
MPESVAYLLHKVPAHFSKSAVRRKDFLEIQEIMEGNNPEDLSHPFNKYAETRWLARGKVCFHSIKFQHTLHFYKMHCWRKLVCNNQLFQS